MNFTAPQRANPPFVSGRFDHMIEALEYASLGAAGSYFYSGKGERVDSLSYLELQEKSQRLAARMLTAGLVHGDRVGLVAETDADFLVSFFACQYAGLVPTPLPLPATFGGGATYIAHLQGMIGGVAARALLGPASFVDMLEAAAAAFGLTLVGTLDLFDAYRETDASLPRIDPDDLAYIQFSSGSTRFPSGVAVTHRALMTNIHAIAKHGLQITPDDRCISWLPMYHDMGLIGFALTPIAAQLSVDYIPTREFARRPLVWPLLISRNRATLSYSPSFGYELCARRAAKANFDELDLAHWRVAGIGGDMIRPDVLRRFATAFAPGGFHERAYVASYGMAETTLAMSFAPLGQGVEVDDLDLDALEQEQIAKPADRRDAATATRSREFVRCGAALPEHEIAVRHTQTGALLTDGQIGKLMFRGPSLMREYFGEPGATSCALSADGWLDTGDLGYLNGSAVVVTGRSKDLILVHGRNIWPQDIEWAVEAEVSGLRQGDVAAFSVDDGDTEHVVLLVQCRTSDEDKRRALKQAVVQTARLHAGVDCEIVLVPSNSLPKTSSGKLSRSGARKQYAQMPDARTSSQRDPTSDGRVLNPAQV